MITVNDVLALPEISLGKPTVVAGHAGLGNEVRWVHVSELPDIGQLLHGGELILTTGLGLGTEIDGYREYIHQLAAHNVSGIVVELGRRFSSLPAPLLKTADRRGLPVIQLAREIRFVEVTQAVHSRIVDNQLEKLRRSELIHQAFTELTLEGAPVEDILDRAAQLTGHPVVLENLAHQVLAVADLHHDLERTLYQWESRSRAVRLEGTGYDPGAGLLVTDVGARAETWGRLALVSDAEPDNLAGLVIERAATAIALRRLVEANQLSQELQTQASLLSDMMNRSFSSAADVQLRSRALGVSLQDRALTGVAVRFQSRSIPRLRPAESHRRSEFVARITRDCKIPALVGAFGPDIRMLLALPPAADHSQALSRLTGRIRSEAALTEQDQVSVIGVGRTVGTVADAARSLNEASQVAEAAQAGGADAAYATIADIRLRGVLHILRSDPLLQSFAERELGALRRHDRSTGGNLVDVLRAYIDNAGNKSLTASALHLSRPALYQRLDRIAEILDADIDNPESRLSLHAAMIVSDSLTAPGRS